MSYLFCIAALRYRQAFGHVLTAADEDRRQEDRPGGWLVTISNRVDLIFSRR